MNQERKNYRTIDEYIQDFPTQIQEILEKIRDIIRNAAPMAEETISYQIPTFKLKNKNLIHFAAFKKHIGVYPTPEGMIAFKDELSKYSSGKGSVQFPLNQPIPFDLIHEIVIFRVNSI